MPPTSWPKILPALTPAQQQRSDEFMHRWHEELARRPRYGLIERFNHCFPVRHSPADFVTTLEIGAGLGEHLAHEKLTPAQEQNYYCNELRENMAEAIRRRWPRVQTVVADCQQPLPFADGFFDRYIAVHVLEHLPNLPAAIREAHRLLNNSRGRMLIVVPTEGSPAYTLARKLSAERLWRRHYAVPYAEFYQREHLNRIPEILAELAPWFSIESKSCFPLPLLPFYCCNLCVGLVLRPRPLNNPT